LIRKATQLKVDIEFHKFSVESLFGMIKGVIVVKIDRNNINSQTLSLSEEDTDLVPKLKKLLLRIVIARGAKIRTVTYLNCTLGNIQRSEVTIKITNTG
jgi:hypothetical protein